MNFQIWHEIWQKILLLIKITSTKSWVSQKIHWWWFFETTIAYLCFELFPWNCFGTLFTKQTLTGNIKQLKKGNHSHQNHFLYHTIGIFQRLGTKLIYLGFQFLSSDAFSIFIIIFVFACIWECKYMWAIFFIVSVCFWHFCR